MSIICSICGRDNLADAKYCDECGVELRGETKLQRDSIVYEEDLEVEMQTADFSANLKEKYDELDDTIQNNIDKNSLSSPLATCVEKDEPEIASLPLNSPATTVELSKAALICQDTNTRYEIPADQTVINIGRVNEQFSIHIDLTHITHANLISRIHASIRWEQNRYYLEDVGSSNGTWLNGKPIKPGTRFRQEIHDRDTIAFGRSQTVKFTVELN